MEKGKLRDKLFEKYFEVDDGVLASELVDKLSFIPETWGNLRSLCVSNVKFFQPFYTLEKVKMLDYHNKKYLILKIRMNKYIIIDVTNKKSLSQEEFLNEFDENFFIANFDEVKLNDVNAFSRRYHILSYNGNIDELLNFYAENEDVLSLSQKIEYTIEIGNAWTYFYIYFPSANARLGFQTPDQFLYENLFLKYDLSPSGLQDAQEKIGLEKMREIFSRIKDIKIPKEYIPKDLYDQFLIQCNSEPDSPVKQLAKKM